MDVQGYVGVRVWASKGTPMSRVNLGQSGEKPVRPGFVHER